MESISHQTKITIGLAITAATVIFGGGYFIARQDGLQDRVAKIEADKVNTEQLGKDVAVIKNQVQSLDVNLNKAIVRWDKHIDESKN